MPEPSILSAANLKLWLDQNPNNRNAAIITVISSGEAPLVQTPNQLKLQFDDIEDSKMDGKLCTEADVKKAIAFAKKNAKIPLVICGEEGVSRSAALYLVIMCARHPSKPEQDVAERLLDRVELATPNEHVCAVGDKVLGRAPPPGAVDESTGQRLRGRIEVAAAKVNFYQEKMRGKRERTKNRVAAKEARENGEQW